MHIQLYTAPTLEPITLAQLKEHLLLDSDTFSGNIDSTQSIAPGSHAIAASYSLAGTGVDVLGYEAVFEFSAGACGSGGTIDVKIQESDDNVTYADWSGGAFAQVTESNDNATYEKAYTGEKQYARVVCTVAGAACEFGVSVIRNVATTGQDDTLTELMEMARIQVESDTNRKIINQTWDYYPQFWPDCDRIKIPFGWLQSVTSVSYKDTDGDETTLTENTDYLVETNGDACGYIVLPYQDTWPDATLYPSNPIKIRFVCGYGSAQSDVPATVKQAVKRACAYMYEYRGEMMPVNMMEDLTYRTLIGKIPRLYDMDFI